MPTYELDLTFPNPDKPQYYKWVFLELNTQDGETLEYTKPFRTIAQPSKDKMASLIKCYDIQDPKGRLLVKPATVCYDTEKEALSAMLQSAKYAFKWFDNSNNAPPTNVEIYKQKTYKLINELIDIYGKEYPELFI